MLRILDAGESHGSALTAIVDGYPAGVRLSLDRINELLAARQMGYGRGNRQKIEKDRLEVESGVRHGVTLGSPITLRIPNRDWANWEGAMHPWDAPAAAEGRAKKIRRPRPGHADLAGALKYRFDDVRNALERASARHTAMRAAAGALCYEFLLQLGVTGVGFVTAVGSESAEPPASLGIRDIDGLNRAIERASLRCPDRAAEARMIELISRCKKEGDSLGGVVEVWYDGLVPGLGSYAQWDRRLDGRLAQSLMSIQAIKGVEIGLGFRYAAHRGSESHDGIVVKGGRVSRSGNNSGGLEGGMTSGERLVIRAGMKPLPTLVKPLQSVNLETGAPEKATVERTDVCAIAAASVIAFAVTAITLTDACLEKFGGDQMDDIAEAVGGYRERIGKVLDVGRE